VTVPFENGLYRALTDNTAEGGEGVLLLRTKQNAPYVDKAAKAYPVISPAELISEWDLGDIKVVGVTGTNGKTTVTALIYSLLIDLGYSVGLQGTRGFFVNDRLIEKRGMTTPSILQTLWNIKRAKEAGSDFFIMEVSSHAIEQERIEGLTLH
jgi:UDP-N-acetylmuramoyl-L-alanyl-D-glutamate--2,6-diaminopimelate ligase